VEERTGRSSGPVGVAAGPDRVRGVPRADEAPRQREGRLPMGDKGKKDKNKDLKQKSSRHEQENKKKQEKQAKPEKQGK
jgi:hypothetical protein